MNVVPITLVPDPLDDTLVDISFFRQRDDGMKPLISRVTHQIVQVRRMLNRGLLCDCLAQRSKIADLRGAGDLNGLHAWHGTRKMNPVNIATSSNSFMVQSGGEDGPFLIYVDYSGKQVLPMFLVTYKEGASREGPSVGVKRGRVWLTRWSNTDGTQRLPHLAMEA